MNRSYGYCRYTPRARKTICDNCGSTMHPSSGDPRDKKLLCHVRACNDELLRKAGRLGDSLSAYGAACERGHCL